MSDHSLMIRRLAAISRTFLNVVQAFRRKRAGLGQTTRSHDCPVPDATSSECFLFVLLLPPKYTALSSSLVSIKNIAYSIVPRMCWVFNLCFRWLNKSHDLWTVTHFLNIWPSSFHFNVISKWNFNSFICKLFVYLQTLTNTVKKERKFSTIDQKYFIDFVFAPSSTMLQYNS